MLRLAINRKLGSNALPAHLTTLSVSWLNNQFKAVAVHRGAVEGQWERPGDTDSPDQFDSYLREAVQQTGYRGQNVSLVLAHPRLVQQLVDVPPVKGAAVQKVLQRQAQQQKMFPGEAAWASQASPSGKSAPRVVMHLFPRVLLNQFIQGCKRNGLHLSSVLPPSAVLHHQLTQLPLAKEEVGVLAAETGGSTTLVAGRGDGQILLARTLPGTWNGEADRLAVDINRTVSFINQQYNVTLNKGLWLFGPGAPEQCATLQRHLQLPISVSPAAYDPFYWATESLKLRAELSPNFISRELQQAPQRRVFATVVAGGVGLILLLSLAASAFLYFQARLEAGNIKKLSEQLARLQTQHRELQQRHDDLDRKRRTLKLVVDDRWEPVPVWLLGYLSETVPPELVLTNLHLNKQGDGLWKVQLAGTFQTQPGEQPATSAKRSAAVAGLVSQLSNGPFHLTLSDPNQKKEPTAADTVSGLDIGRWVSKLTGGQPAPKPPESNHFLIEGFLQ